MQPFDDSLYSGYSTYNNWAKVPSSPSSLAKAGFAWGLTGTAAASAFNTATPLTSQTLGYGSTSNAGNAASNYMYSAVVSASSNSPTTSDQDLSKADLQQYSNMTSKLKAREDDIAARDDENPRDSTPYNNNGSGSATTPNALV